ncbi:MAG: ATP-binding cassette domain-containing protein [Prevotellaceae bacterium]|jgi:ABC-type lipoprotein export system ATPase subunit|nr:ATP-binding cassette domain-containing protein [Prevotellaceae bacterium]
MSTITLDHLIPNVFAETDLSKSAIWNKMVSFFKGDYYIIAAESGSGKSSLFDYIYGRRTDYSGTLTLDGNNIATINPSEKQKIRREQLSVVFQGFRLFPELTAWENIMLKNKLTNHKTEEEIKHFFDQLGVAETREKPLAKLSFGQQQRVAIIRALCQPFDFLMLDEPFSHLDDQNVKIALSLIMQEVKKQEAGLMLCTLGGDYNLSFTNKLYL